MKNWMFIPVFASIALLMAWVASLFSDRFFGAVAVIVFMQMVIPFFPHFDD